MSSGYRLENIQNKKCEKTWKACVWLWCWKDTQKEIVLPVKFYEFFSSLLTVYNIQYICIQLMCYKWVNVFFSLWIILKFPKKNEEIFVVQSSRLSGSFRLIDVAQGNALFYLRISVHLFSSLTIPSFLFFSMFHTDNLWGSQSLLKNQKNKKQKEISSGNLLPTKKNLIKQNELSYFSQRSNSIVFIHSISGMESVGGFFFFVFCCSLCFVQTHVCVSHYRYEDHLKQREKYYEKNALQIHDFYNNNNGNGET